MSSQSVIPVLLETDYRLHVRAFTSRDLSSVGITLSSKAKQTLRDWIPIHNRLFIVQLNRTVQTQKYGNVCCCFFFVSVCSPNDCSSDEVIDGFYSKLFKVRQNAKCSDIVIVVGGFNAQADRINQTRRYLYGSYGVATQQTDNSDRLRQLCCDKSIFANNKFKH